MANFTINMPEGETIYRCSKNYNINGHWFGYNPEDLKGYGYIINTFQTTKPLKLINLISGAFHTDYMDKLNLLYTGTNYDGIDERKFLALLPIGLPNQDIQSILLKKLGYVYENNRSQEDKNTIDLCTNTYNNRFRYSYNELDKHLIDAMTKIYSSEYDGFTSPLRWYNEFKGEFMHREIYLFDLNSVKLISSDKFGPSGGGSSLINKSIKNTNEGFEQLHKMAQELSNKIPTRTGFNTYKMPSENFHRKYNEKEDYGHRERIKSYMDGLEKLEKELTKLSNTIPTITGFNTYKMPGENFHRKYKEEDEFENKVTQFEEYIKNGIKNIPKIEEYNHVFTNTFNNTSSDKNTSVETTNPLKKIRRTQKNKRKK
jgi:hypothetical protein